jgi:hypothetical protein
MPFQRHLFPLLMDAWWAGRCHLAGVPQISLSLFRGMWVVVIATRSSLQCSTCRNRLGTICFNSDEHQALGPVASVQNVTNTLFYYK